MNDNLKFLSLVGRHPRSLGAILPSSSALARNVIAPIAFDKASALVEVGPGTGPITKEIISCLSSRTKYIGIERNQEFYETVKAKFPSLEFVHDSVENLPSILEKAGIKEGVDAVISGIPWTFIPAEQWGPLLAAIKKSLKPGGIFINYVYITGLLFSSAYAFRRHLEADFAKVETTPIVWLNVPPAFAYVCHR